MRKFFTCFIILFSAYHFVHAQVIDDNRVFRGGVFAGFNASQIDGDNLGGYHQFGFAGGVTNFIRLSDKFTLNINLEYSQKGARTRLDSDFPTSTYKLRLDYLDVPVLFHFHHFERVMLGGGLSLNALVRWREYVDGFPSHEAGSTPYSRFDLMAVASIGYFFTKHIGIDFRYNYTLIPVRPQPPLQTTFWRNNQYNNVMSFRLIFLF